MSEVERSTDGILIRENVVDDGMLYGRLLQPNRGEILNNNAELRKNPDALRKMQSMGLELTIPEVDYYYLRKKYPDLASHDKEVKKRAWLKFIGSSESQPYRVR